MANKRFKDLTVCLSDGLFSAIATASLRGKAVDAVVAGDATYWSAAFQFPVLEAPASTDNVAFAADLRGPGFLAPWSRLDRIQLQAVVEVSSGPSGLPFFDPEVVTSATGSYRFFVNPSHEEEVPVAVLQSLADDSTAFEALNPQPPSLALAALWWFLLTRNRMVASESIPTLPMAKLVKNFKTKQFFGLARQHKGLLHFLRATRNLPAVFHAPQAAMADLGSNLAAWTNVGMAGLKLGSFFVEPDANLPTQAAATVLVPTATPPGALDLHAGLAIDLRFDFGAYSNPSAGKNSAQVGQANVLAQYAKWAAAAGSQPSGPLGVAVAGLQASEDIVIQVGEALFTLFVLNAIEASPLAVGGASLQVGSLAVDLAAGGIELDLHGVLQPGGGGSAPSAGQPTSSTTEGRQVRLIGTLSLNVNAGTGTVSGTFQLHLLQASLVGETGLWTVFADATRPFDLIEAAKTQALLNIADMFINDFGVGVGLTAIAQFFVDKATDLGNELAELVGGTVPPVEVPTVTVDVPDIAGIVGQIQATVGAFTSAAVAATLARATARMLPGGIAKILRIDVGAGLITIGAKVQPPAQAEPEAAEPQLTAVQTWKKRADTQVILGPAGATSGPSPIDLAAHIETATTKLRVTSPNLKWLAGLSAIWEQAPLKFAGKWESLSLGPAAPRFGVFGDTWAWSEASGVAKEPLPPAAETGILLGKVTDPINFEIPGLFEKWLDARVAAVVKLSGSEKVDAVTAFEALAFADCVCVLANDIPGYVGLVKQGMNAAVGPYLPADPTLDDDFAPLFSAMDGLLAAYAAPIPGAVGPFRIWDGELASLPMQIGQVVASVVPHVQSGGVRWPESGLTRTPTFRRELPPVEAADDAWAPKRFP